jgi:hypothetical protein
MKKFIFCLLLIPVLGMGQKSVINSSRYFPKVDKVLEFEKALTAHSQQYHKGDWAWRVFEIQTGPDAGGYHVTEGPASWESIDTRGNLGTEHNTNWNKTVAIYLTDRGSSGFYEFHDSLSTIGLTDWADKIMITHTFPKPGMIVNVIDLVKKLKNVWVAGNEKVAVYQATGSGAPQIATTTRYKNGLKELAPGYRKPIGVMFESVNGAGSWNSYLQDYAKYVESRWSELLFYRAELSSK